MLEIDGPERTFRGLLADPPRTALAARRRPTLPDRVKGERVNGASRGALRLDEGRIVRWLDWIPLVPESLNDLVPLSGRTRRTGAAAPTEGGAEAVSFSAPRPTR